MPQPGTADNSTVVKIHALTPHSEKGAWKRELDDFVKQYCMAQRKAYFRNGHAPEIPFSQPRQGGTKARNMAYSLTKTQLESDAFVQQRTKLIASGGARTMDKEGYLSLA